MTISYIQSNPLNVEFKTTYGTPAAGMWAFFYSSIDQTQKKNAYKLSGNSYVDAPNPIQLDASGGFPLMILFKYNSDSPSDKYVIKIRETDSELSPILKTYIDIPRSGLYSQVGSSTSNPLAGYPEVSTGNVGDVLEITTDPVDPSNKIAVFKSLNVSFAEQSIVNSVLSGCSVTLLPSGTDISISAGKCLFVTKGSSEITASTIVDFQNIPSIPIPNIANNDYTFVYLKNDGTAYTSNAATEDFYGNYILLCSINHNNRASVSDIVYRCPIGVGVSSQIRSIYDLLGFTTTCTVSKNAPVDGLNITSGTFYGFDVGLVTSSIVPHSISMQSVNAASIYILSEANVQTGLFTYLNSTNLLKEDGTQVTSGKYAYFPIYQASNGRIVIQRTDKEYDQLPEFSEWYEEFPINDSLDKRYAVLGGIAYKGGTPLSDANNSVFNVKNLNGKVFNVSSIESLPEIPSDLSKAGYLIGVSDDNSRYEFRIKWDKTNSVQDGLASYDPSTNTFTFKPISISSGTSDLSVSFDRPVSPVMQRGGVITQRKSTDYVPKTSDEYVDFNRYGGNYIFDVSRGYTQNFTNNTAADPDVKSVKFSDLFTLVSFDKYDQTKYSTVFNGCPSTITVNNDSNVPQSVSRVSAGAMFSGFLLGLDVDVTVRDIFRIISSFQTSVRTKLFPIYNFDCGIFFEKMIKNYFDVKNIPEGNVFIWKNTTMMVNNTVSSSNRNTSIDEGTNPPSGIAPKEIETFIDKSQDTGINSINVSSNPIKISLISPNSIYSQYIRIESSSDPLYYIEYHSCNRFYYLMSYRTLLSSVSVSITMNFLLKINLSDSILSFIPDGTDFLTICCRFSSSINNQSSVVVNNSTTLEFGGGFGFFVVFKKDSYRILSFDTTGDLIEANPTIVTSNLNNIKQLLSNGIKFKSDLNSPISYYGKDKTLLNGNRFFMCSISPNVKISSLVKFADVSVDLNISGFIQTPGMEHVRLDAVKLGQFNVATDTTIMKKGLRTDDIVAGVVHFEVTWVLKNNRNPLEYMELNPRNINLSPFRLILIDGSAEVKCDLNDIFVGRAIYSATVNQTQITNSIVALRVYKKGDIQPVVADILDRYTITLGVYNRQGTN